jgi:hypothetical protein
MKRTVTRLLFHFQSEENSEAFQIIRNYILMKYVVARIHLILKKYYASF